MQQKIEKIVVVQEDKVDLDNLLFLSEPLSISTTYLNT